MELIKVGLRRITVSHKTLRRGDSLLGSSRKEHVQEQAVGSGMCVCRCHGERRDTPLRGGRHGRKETF